MCSFYFNYGFQRIKVLQSKQMVSVCSDTAQLLINVENTEAAL